MSAGKPAPFALRGRRGLAARRRPLRRGLASARLAPATRAGAAGPAALQACPLDRRRPMAHTDARQAVRVLIPAPDHPTTDPTSPSWRPGGTPGRVGPGPPALPAPPHRGPFARALAGFRYGAEARGRPRQGPLASLRRGSAAKGQVGWPRGRSPGGRAREMGRGTAQGGLCRRRWAEPGPRCTRRCRVRDQALVSTEKYLPMVRPSARWRRTRRTVPAVEKATGVAERKSPWDAALRRVAAHVPRSLCFSATSTCGEFRGDYGACNFVFGRWNLPIRHLCQLLLAIFVVDPHFHAGGSVEARDLVSGLFRSRRSPVPGKRNEIPS